MIDCEWLSRRDFLRCSANGVLAAAAGELAFGRSDGPGQPARPNILWIVSEDNGPQLGAYGDTYADTPTLDRLARQGVRYTRVSSNAPVCAPARSTLITGMYAPSIGSQHMRSRAVLPGHMRFLPHYLREAGYYCSNNAKEDYNINTPPGAWDESGRKAHWRKRAPGQPFFSVFNIAATHESRIWPRGDGTTRHDPSVAPIPPYHPDTPEVRRDWAQYYDNLTRTDQRVAAILGELGEDGLADETIVFYYADHGPGMPRSKRWLYESGLRVPLIIRFPEKYRRLAPAEPGGALDRLVSFVDFGPTVLSLAGVPIPDHLQGQAFLGSQARAARRYTYGYRDRMDERYDMSRSVFDGRYKYIRNYLPHRPYAQYLEYQYRMPTMRVWQELHDAGKLSGPPAAFFAPKPTEELYDLGVDPYEVANLAGSQQHEAVRNRLRRELARWMIQIRDVGLLPEAEVRRRSQGGAEYLMAQNPLTYPMGRIIKAAEIAGHAEAASLSGLVALFDDPDSAVRYWAAVGCVVLAGEAKLAHAKLLQMLNDPAPSVRVAAAEALCGIGEPAEALPVLVNALADAQVEVRLQAAIVLDLLDEEARPAVPAMRKALEAKGKIPGDRSGYVTRVLRKALADLNATPNQKKKKG